MPILVGTGWYIGVRPGRTGELPQASPTYVATNQCGACHAGKHREYQHVAMSQSMRTMGKATRVPHPTEATFLHAKSQRHYQIMQRNGTLVQRRYELDEKGQQQNAYELEATHAVGSGRHAISYLHRSASGELFQLPLTWYAQERSWNMSPGYDNPTPQDFTRQVDDTCLFCHNAYPQKEALAEGIDCQRCHGPGSEHIRLASAARTSPERIRASIVNPKSLSAERQMDICMQCHLETTSADLPQMIRRFGRGTFSFRPGEPLGNYMVHFDHPPDSAYADKFEIVNQAYRLRKSACFRESNGRMTCSSCHDPHSVPRGAEAVAHYRSKCMACHPSVEALDHPPLAKADCTPCHMPQRRAEDAVHVVMTDHLVQRRPGKDLTRPLNEHASSYRGPIQIYQPSGLSADDRVLYLGIALIRGSADRSRGIQLLQHATKPGSPAQALAVLGEGYLQEGQLDSAIAAFQRALTADPSLSNARYNLAQALQSSGRLGEARTSFEQAIQSRPRFPEADYALGNLLMQMGDSSAAAHRYASAIKVRPLYAEARSSLGNLRASQGRLNEALEELEQAIRIDPAYAEAHSNVARVLAMLHRLPEALTHARRAVSLKPEYAEARYNLARLLHEMGSTGMSIAEYQRLIRLRPNMIEAHLGLGQTLGDSGQLGAAIAEFREVLRLQAGHLEAQRNLDMALSLKQSGGR